jgi:sugar phosphate isomerase/epimerase
MRLGAPLFEDASTPEKWVAALRKKGYSAAFCPVGTDASDQTVAEYEQVAKENGIVIAEVGAWSSPLCRDGATAADGRRRCVEGLRLADRIGANCCVNVSGSRGLPWYGPDPENLTQATFDLIVEFVQWLIDEVKPTRTCFALETMEWMYPDSPESYAQLVRAIDREHFGVHFDPTNLVCSPQLYYRTGEIITEFVTKLGPKIKSCHAKDISLSEKLTVHLDEVLPGEGNLDYRTFLRELNTLGPDVPLLIEHLTGEEQFDQAAAFIRKTAEEVGVTIQ